MRLLEPLSGVKTAQGHALVHLIFFLTMFSIPRDLDVEHRANNNKPALFLMQSGEFSESKLNWR